MTNDEPSGLRGYQALELLGIEELSEEALAESQAKRRARIEAFEPPPANVRCPSCGCPTPGAPDHELTAYARSLERKVAELEELLENAGNLTPPDTGLAAQQL